MMKKLITLVWLLWAGTVFALYQADFYPPAGTQVYDYETFRKGAAQPLFRERFTVSQEKFRGQDFVVIKSNSRAVSGEPERFDKQTLTYYQVQNDRLSTYFHENKTSRNDQPYLDFKINFDWQHKQANYSLENFEQQKQQHDSLRLSSNTMPTHDLVIFFQNMLMKQQSDQPFTVIFPNGRELNLRATLKGQERIKTKAGEFDCQRIAMKPDFPLLSFFAPSVTFWLMSQPPYSYVRYEGPERGLGSATVVQELVGTSKL